jgi:hypothetical protein
MSGISRALVLAGVVAAFLTASLTPCPSARVVRVLDSDPVMSAPCPCHCGDHAATSPASHLDPVLASAVEPLASPPQHRAHRARVWRLASAPRSLPDPVPIAS